VNVALLFPHFNTLDQASSLRSWQIGRFLAARGHDVTAFAPGVDLRSGELFPEMRGRIYATQDVEGVRLIRVYSLPHLRRSAKRRLAFEIIYAVMTMARALAIRGMDVVVVSYPPAVIPIFGYLVGRLRRRPVIFEMRDLMADGLAATGYVRSRRFVDLAKRAEQFVIDHCDHVITVSNGIKKAVVARGVDDAKVTVVTNGYEPEVFAAADYSWQPRQEFGWGERFVVVYAGALTQAYDIPTLLRAATRLRDHDDILFVLVGEGDRKAEYQAHCDQHGLRNVQFIDYQPRRKMPVLLSAANAGVHLFRADPLWRYVLGNKPFDYLGSGLPMIYAGEGDTAELIEDAGAGFVVTPEDDRALADAVLTLKQDSSRAAEMGARGREYVSSRYNRPKLLERFEETLHEVVRSHTA
jgi:glycosyltransferase involved in cell wall biosynthesis